MYQIISKHVLSCTGIWANEVITNMKKKAEGSEDMKDLKMVFYSSVSTLIVVAKYGYAHCNICFLYILRGLLIRCRLLIANFVALITRFL